MISDLTQFLFAHVPVNLDTPPRVILIITHIIGVVLGVGGATASDLIFLKSIRDGEITRTEISFLNTVSFMVWSGLVIIVLSGFGFLYLAGFVTPALRDAYSVAKIVSKLVITAIILGNGILLNIKIMPLFEAYADRSLATREFTSRIPLIFTSGAISAVSWYTALILGAWRSFKFSLSQTLIAYGIALVVAIIIANIIGFIWRRRLIRNN